MKNWSKQSTWMSILALSIMTLGAPSFAAKDCCKKKQGTGKVAAENIAHDDHAAPAESDASGHEVKEKECCKKSESKQHGKGKEAETPSEDHQENGEKAPHGSEDKECCKKAQKGDHKKETAKSSVSPLNDPEVGHGEGHTKTGHGSKREMAKIFHALIENHKHIERKVEEIPGGVKTVTISHHPDTLAILRKHVRQVRDELMRGGRVRNWDPVFAEIFAHHDKIKMEYRDIEDGIEVIETSEDPQVTKLIRAHAAKVSDFAKRGKAAMHEPTDLPNDYKPTVKPSVHGGHHGPKGDRNGKHND